MKKRKDKGKTRKFKNLLRLRLRNAYPGRRKLQVLCEPRVGPKVVRVSPAGEEAGHDI